MGKWKKAVAALAAVPMLMALAPAANAVESDPTDSSAAQRALAAWMRSRFRTIPSPPAPIRAGRYLRHRIRMRRPISKSITSA